MNRLGDLLVGAGLASSEQRSRALARQAKTGGRLGTAFLEEGLSEEALLLALSRQQGVPAVPVAELEDVKSDVLRLIPPKVALRLRAVPLHRDGRRLTVALRDPKDLPALDEIATLTGLSVEPRVATDAAIHAALSKHYGSGVHPRYTALARRAPPPPVSQAKPRAPVTHAPRLWAVPLAEQIGAEPYPVRADRGPDTGDPWGQVEVVTGPLATARALESQFVENSLRSTEEPEPEAMEFPRKPEPLPPPPDDRAAPMPEAVLAGRLAAASDREEIAEIILDAACRHLRRVALFVSSGDSVTGWAAWPEPHDEFRSLPFFYGEPSIFTSLRNTEGYYVGPFPELPSTARLRRALGSEGPGVVAVVPVNLRGRTVLYLWGESDSWSHPPSIATLKRLAAMAATALEILALKRRLGNL